MSETLTTGQVANYCHVTYWTVIKWIKAGKIKAYKSPGDHNRIRKEDFLRFLQEYNLPVPQELIDEHGKRLLIVDDDTAVVELLTELLGDIEDLEIETARNGYEAGMCIATFRPHVIILDLWMPGINGFEVCKHLKYNPETSAIKILAITGYPCGQSMRKISSIGADYLLEKPLNTEHLRDIIVKMVADDSEQETHTVRT
jgi:excisionase family DNA binding protein